MVSNLPFYVICLVFFAFFFFKCVLFIYYFKPENIWTSYPKLECTFWYTAWFQINCFCNLFSPFSDSLVLCFKPDTCTTIYLEKDNYYLMSLMPLSNSTKLIPPPFFTNKGKWVTSFSFFLPFLWYSVSNLIQ